jgi:hypothetical protein
MIFVDSEDYLDNFMKSTSKLDYIQFTEVTNSKNMDNIKLSLSQIFYGRKFLTFRFLVQKRLLD